MVAVAAAAAIAVPIAAVRQGRAFQILICDRAWPGPGRIEL